MDMIFDVQKYITEINRQLAGRAGFYKNTNFWTSICKDDCQKGTQKNISLKSAAVPNWPELYLGLQIQICILATILTRAPPVFCRPQYPLLFYYGMILVDQPTTQRHRPNSALPIFIDKHTLQLHRSTEEKENLNTNTQQQLSQWQPTPTNQPVLPPPI